MKLKLHHLNLSTQNVAEMNEFYKEFADEIALVKEFNQLRVIINIAIKENNERAGFGNK